MAKSSLPRSLIAAACVTLLFSWCGQELLLLYDYSLSLPLQIALKFSLLHALIALIMLSFFSYSRGGGLVSAGWLFLFGPLLFLVSLLLIENSGLSNLAFLQLIGPLLTLVGWILLGRAIYELE